MNILLKYLKSPSNTAQCFINCCFFLLRCVHRLHCEVTASTSKSAPYSQLWGMISEDHEDECGLFPYALEIFVDRAEKV